MYIFGVSYSQNMVIFDEFRQTISTSIKLLFLNRGVQYTDFFMYKYIMLSSSTVLLAQCFEETYFLSLINCCNKMNISGPDLFSLFFKCRKIRVRVISKLSKPSKPSKPLDLTCYLCYGHSYSPFQKQSLSKKHTKSKSIPN